MAIPGSGSISIKSSSGAGRSIAQEVDGNVTGNKSLTTLSVAAGKTAPHGITEFYNYTSNITITFLTDLISGSTTINTLLYRINGAGSPTTYTAPFQVAPTDTLEFRATFTNNSSTTYEDVRIYCIDGSEFATTPTSILNPNVVSGNTATPVLGGIIHGTSYTVYASASARVTPPGNNVNISYTAGSWNITLSRPLVGAQSISGLTAFGTTFVGGCTTSIQTSFLSTSISNNATTKTVTDNSLTCSTQLYKLNGTVTFGGVNFASSGTTHIVGNNNISLTWNPVFCTTYPC